MKKKIPNDHISTHKKVDELELQAMKALFSQSQNKHSELKVFKNPDQRPKNGIVEIIDPEKNKCVAREIYINGQLNGPMTWFYPNGKISMKYNFFNGQQHGLCEIFYEDGTKWRSGLWQMGKLVGTHEDFHENGSLHQRSFYKNGKLEGKVMTYLDTGELEWEKEYLNGEEI